MTSLFIWILSLPLFGATSEDPSYCQVARRITSQHIEVMKNEGFVVSMTGGGFMTGVEEISLGFEKRIAPSLAEARVLYVGAVRDLLDRINSSEEVRPFLRKFPFLIDNLTYDLRFNRTAVTKSGVEPIALVSYGGGTVNYSVFDPSDGHGNPLRNVHRESFDEAERLVATDAEKSSG